MAWTVRAMVPVLLAILIVPSPAGAASTPAAMMGTSPAGEPSYIFVNGEVVTVDPTIPAAQALMVRGARIQAIGSDAIVQSSRTPGTTVIDLAGHVLVPGFIDAHTHLLQSSWLQDKTLEEVIDVALRYGVTTIQEVWADEEFLDELFEAERGGELRLRVNAYPVYNAARLDDEGRTIIREEWFPAHDPILDPDRMLRIPGIKIYADGGGGPPRGCPALTEPWAEEFRNDPSFFCFDERGDLYLSQEQLDRVVAEAQDAGFRVAIHAVGDRAIDTVLNAIERALKGQSNDRYRHQIHHNSLLRPDQLPRYVDLRMVASVRGYGPTCWQDLNEFWYGPDRLEWVANRYALPALGVHAFGEGDFSWTNDPDDRTFFRPINPILTLYGLVTRKQLQADGTTCDPRPWLARHEITAEQALRMVTIEGAYAASQDRVIGSLRPGKLADVVVLSANPLTVPPDEIKDIEVLLTMVNGRVEYCAPIYAFYCANQDRDLDATPSANGEREVVSADSRAAGRVAAFRASVGRRSGWRAA